MGGKMERRQAEIQREKLCRGIQKRGKDGEEAGENSAGEAVWREEETGKD